MYIFIGYYTGGCSVRLDILTSLTYFAEFTGQDKILKHVIMYSSTVQLIIYYTTK